MPPPPPPSKSYLLRFDSSSDDESSHSSSDEEERERERERRRLQEKREQIIRNLKIAKQEQEKREREKAAATVAVEVKTDAVTSNDTGGDDDSEDDDLKEDVSTTPKKKKKKRKKKRRKKKKGAGDREENNLTTDADNDAEIDIHADPVTENEAKAETFSGADNVTNATVKSASESDPSTMKSSQTLTQRQTKVKFQNVQVAEFIRDVGGDGIPADGGYPLCLSDVNTTSYNIPIDTFETKKQIGLRERYTQQVFDRRMRQWKREHENKDSGHGHGHGHHGRRRKRSNSINSKPKSGHDSHHNNHSQNNQNHSKSNDNDSHHHQQNMPHLPVFIPEGYEFETRQFDYKPRRDDKHRHWLINTITSSTNDKEELESETKSEWKEIKNTGRNTLFGQLHESERKQLLLRDAEEGAGAVPTASTTENDHVSSSSSSPSGKKSRSTRRRKGSISSQHDYDYHDQSHQTFATETCTASSISSTIHDSTHIKHIRNELEKIRIQRTAEDAAGCSCRKLYVSVGKGSHHHRRLTERRVKDELRKRHVNIPTSLSTNTCGGKSKKGDASSRNAMREQLEQMLHDIVEREGCCYGNDCICVRNGVGCNANTCSCWHASHGGHGGHHPSSTSPYQVSIEDAKRNCGNANGMYMTDFEQIEAYRSKYITALQKEDYCRDAN